MATTDELAGYLGEYLRVGEVPDYPNAHNGLQLANGDGEVKKVGAAVDACLPVVREAVDQGIDFLMVHHGMFWSGVQRIEGAVYERVKAAMDGEMAIYSSHLPLDVHGEVGNNAILCGKLGIGETEPFLEWKGIHLGLRSEVEMGREELRARLSEALDGGKVHVCPGGPETVRRVGVVTGGAGGEVAQAAAEGVDTLVTGEGPHWSYTAAEELGVNVLYGGHYATETFGVKALAAHVAEREGVAWEFVDHPTGL
ncbi:MAG: Nif3-like dinuclear metal center hexameric protein [Verrucomicrobiota bacterium]